MYTLIKYSDQSDSVNCICPYCKHTYQVEAEDYGTEIQEIECDECNSLFYLYSEFDVTHHTIPDCELNKKEHVWERICFETNGSYYNCKICGKVAKL